MEERNDDGGSNLQNLFFYGHPFRQESGHNNCDTTHTLMSAPKVMRDGQLSQRLGARVRLCK